METKDFYLTNREFQIFENLVKNREALAIADKLFISYRTVTTHRDNIYRKTGCSSNQELMLYALHFKFFTVEELAAAFTANWKELKKK